jgi:uncharacterized membrane protein YadS
MSTVATAAPASVAEVQAAEASRPPLVGEDWLACLVGAALIGLVLLGARPANAVQMAVLVLVPLTMGAALLRARVLPFVAGAAFVAALGWGAQQIAALPLAAAYGLEYVIFGLAIGLVVGHAVPLPAWLREAVRTEYYIKTGLVVLGAGILFNEIARAGLLGIAQALVVVLSVWSFCFWLCRKLGVDDELATMLSSAVSICGVSAAIAACGAIQGDKKKLSYVSSLVLIVAMPMMVLMPWIATVTGMPEMVAGAWLGGTLDTSAAVVAGGEMLGEAARDAAVVVKLSQNALIGFAALGLTIWWAMKHGTQRASADGQSSICDCVKLIWARFPKFVFGFLVASLVFSFLLSSGTVTDTKGAVTGIRTMLFAMAFVSIGLETNLGSLVSTGQGRPAIAFLGGQAFNVVVTLAAAYVFFGLLI